MLLISADLYVFSLAVDVEEELNNLPGIQANCSVTLLQEGANFTYTIMFDTIEGKI